ncbi:hypothetical protein ACFOY4_37640 [Actinomadura syzygii]|uniref:Uncharacterized protein n=1 Tax=Actinomadura syzygii TaxID=1427538 RepID=A0A5D0U6I5_9ACTN|nr:hypothetical protein [Actinomadura syzygii]TYC13232.1 hypothetical protein FXF65_22280 [Actinomadura syzygii]
MTGRHRGQPKDRPAGDEVDEVDERSSRGRRIGIVAGAFIVPIVVASVVAFGLRDEPARERPEAAASGQQTMTPTATPEGEPTYGEYVPPDAEPQAATKAPKRAPAPVTTPRKRKPAQQAPGSRTRRPCPPGWDDVWWLHRWCERNGYRGR